MKIGYACLTKGVKNARFRTCRLQNATDENLREIIEHNLNSLENIIDYNIKNNIKLFRITSDLIPFGSHETNNLDWGLEFKDKFDQIGEKISKSDMRVTMHPGQYTVLNSINQDVVDKAVMDLDYHRRILECLNTSIESKIVLHIGGVYGDKVVAMDRFIENFGKMDESIKDRIVIENDDKSFNIEDVLGVSKKADIPVIFDNLHNEVLPSYNRKEPSEWIKECSHTWKKEDGMQKIHYSQQDNNKKAGGHSTTIDVSVFLQFMDAIQQDIDVMLEVKDKNLSAVKCINATTDKKDIKKLELEWARYKYLILEKDQRTYNKIRELLKDKDSYPVRELYEMIDYALSLDESKKDVVNAALHVWGYFKRDATEKEKLRFMKLIADYEEGQNTVSRFKKMLLQLSQVHNTEYLLNSYYFMDIIK